MGKLPIGFPIAFLKIIILLIKSEEGKVFLLGLAIIAILFIGYACYDTWGKELRARWRKK